MPCSSSVAVAVEAASGEAPGSPGRSPGGVGSLSIAAHLALAALPAPALLAGVSTARAPLTSMILRRREHQRSAGAQDRPRRPRHARRNGRVPFLISEQE